MGCLWDFCGIPMGFLHIYIYMYVWDVFLGVKGFPFGL